MILKNASKKTILSEELKIAASIVDSLFGLLLKRNKSLLLKTRFGIHTFGLSQNIDVLILDVNYKVVKIKKSLTPNKIFFWNPKYSLVIEIPEDIIKKSKTLLGDQLNITNSLHTSA